MDTTCFAETMSHNRQAIMDTCYRVADQNEKFALEAIEINRQLRAQTRRTAEQLIARATDQIARFAEQQKALYASAVSQVAENQKLVTASATRLFATAMRAAQA